MKVGLGLFTCQRYPGDPRRDLDLYRELIAVGEEAERLGFDSVWVSEHHFFDDGYMPSLLPVCAALAARTSRVAIGTAVALAPLYEALRLAEDAATVDLLSESRFVLGLGQGWRAEEFEAFGVPLTDLPRRLEDTVQTLRQAWRGELVTGDPVVSRRGVAVTPRPPRADGPPIWLGGFVESAIRRAARIGDGFIMGRGVTPESVAEKVGWVGEELAIVGRDPERFTFCILVPVLAWPTKDAWEQLREYRYYVSWKYEDMRHARARVGPATLPPPLSPKLDEDLRRESIIGTPNHVSEELLRLEEIAGGNLHCIAWLHWPGMDPSVQREVRAIFAEEVLPGLR